MEESREEKESASEKFVSGKIEGKEGVEGSYFVDSNFKEFFESGYWKIPEKMKAEEIAARFKGKTSHGLFETKTETEEGEKPVLVKPYDLETKKNTRKMNNEFFNILKAKEKGLSKVSPLGISVRKGKGYIYIQPEKDSIPLSALDYEELEENKRKKIVEELGKNLKEWHENGLHFSDAHMRNILIDAGEKGIKIKKEELKKKNEKFVKHLEEFDHSEEENITLSPIDLEKSSIVNRRKLNKEEKGYDVATMTGSMTHFGLIKDKKDLQTFLENYEPEEKDKWIDELKRRTRMHQKDVNIQNLKEKEIIETE